MAVAFVKNHTVASNKTAGTTLAVSLDTSVPAGNLIVCRMVYDNAATASKPLLSSIGVAAGETNTWATATGVNSTSTTAGSFASGAMTYIRTTVSWPAAAYTVTLDTSTVQKAGAFQEFSGTLATLRSTSGTNYSTTTTAASAASTGTAPVSGDLALGFIFGSNAAANQAGDNDTTGGSWSAVAGVGSTGGNVATNNWGVAQYKVVTSTSQQTLNNSAAMTAGNGSIVVILQQYVPPAITQAAYGFYNDGTETGSTTLAATNTAITVDVTAGDVNVLLRERLQSTTAVTVPATDDWQLQWEKNTSGTWNNVNVPGSTLTDSYGSATVDSFLPTGTDSTTTLRGQSFLGNGSPLTKGGFWVRKGTGTPNGTLTAYLYDHTGTFGVNGKPSGTPPGTPLATSSTVITATTLSTTAAWAYFDFDGSFTLNAGTPYFLMLKATNTGVAPNSVEVGVQAASPTHPGNRAHDFTNWVAFASADHAFEVYTTAGTVVAYNSANLTDGAATTNRLGAGTGSFVAGKISETGLVTDLGWSASNYTEVLYSLTLKQADLTNADTLRFRTLYNGATTVFTYTQTPTINVTKTLPAVTQAAYRWYDEGTETGAVALAAQDTPATGDVTLQDGIGQLRIRLQSTNAAPLPATDDWQLQWEKNASGSWLPVTSSTAEALVDSSSTHNSTIQLTSTGQVHAQSFLGNGTKLSKARFYMSKQNSPIGTVGAVLASHTGTYGVDGNGVDPVLTTSTLRNASTIGASTTLEEFVFDQSVIMANGTPYVIGAIRDTADAVNFVNVRTNTTSVHAGNRTSRTSGSWIAFSGSDVAFEVYGVPANDVSPYASPNLTDAAATTNRLAGGTGTFTAGKISETGVVTDVGWSGNNHTELLWSLDINNTQVVNGDTLRFRVLRNGATTGMTFTQVPTINIVKATPTDVAYWGMKIA